MWDDVKGPGCGNTKACVPGLSCCLGWRPGSTFALGLPRPPSPGILGRSTFCPGGNCPWGFALHPYIKVVLVVCVAFLTISLKHSAYYPQRILVCLLVDRLFLLLGGVGIVGCLSVGKSHNNAAIYTWTCGHVRTVAKPKGSCCAACELCKKWTRTWAAVGGMVLSNSGSCWRAQICRGPL